MSVENVDLERARTMAPLVQRRAWSRGLVLPAALIAVALVLLSVNLATFPAPWFDEGYFLSVAKTLALQGQYALPNSDGPWVMDPSINGGPTIIVPMALAFRLLGVEILWARLVAVAVAGLSLAAYLALARRMVGPAAAVVAGLMLLIGSPELFASFTYLGRQVLTEVPALGLGLYGCWLWLRAVDAGRPAGWRLLAAGVVLGLAVVTKLQMLIALGPAFALLCLADARYYRQASLRAFALPLVSALATVGAWVAVQAAVLGPAELLAKVSLLRTAADATGVGLEAAHMRQAAGVVWRSGFLVWGLPGLVYGAAQARRRDRDGLAHGLLLAVAVIWLLWFMFLSVGWERYAFITLALAPIWSARLVAELYARARGWQRAAVALALAALLLVNGRALLGGIFGPQDHSAEQFSAYLRANVPAGAVVESWEWNLDVTTPLRFHHPEPLVMFRTIDIVQGGGQLPAGFYDAGAGQPQYLVDGPFSNWTGIYRTFIADRCERVASVGPYTLYRVARP